MKLFNTLTMQKEDFVPMDEKNVRIYSCGPTVYNFFHIGNARPFIIFDTLRRYMEYKGWNVTFVQNFTDIDDKMISRAREEGITVKELADRFIEEYYTDARGLLIREATHHPRATETIAEIVSMIKTLVDKGYAYEANGDVYFETRKFKDYLKLSHQNIDDLESGARINVSEMKKDPLDFALWKAQKEGEPAWESPFGPGRPGWHIECSAMAKKYLGETIDIHCGGKDLAFPHHENEIAQSECANDKEFARFWLHNGYINVDNEKMSKSLGNFFTVRDAAAVYSYEPIRFFMLSAHYRTPINYSKESLEQAKSALSRLYNCKENLEFLLVSGEEGPESPALRESLEKRREEFSVAMEDDLNTADALAVIFELVSDVNREFDARAAHKKADITAALQMLSELSSVLGLLTREEKALDQEIEELIERRQAARSGKNFAEADRIRDELLSRGIVLKDTPQGVKWSYKE